MTFHISPLTEQYSDEAFELATIGFINGSVLHKALGVELEEYQDYLYQSFKNTVTQGFSLVAQDSDTNNLLGCLVAGDYASCSENPTPPARLQPIIDFLNQLRHQYRQGRSICPGSYLLVDMAIVSSSATGLGIYHAMRMHAHQVGKDAGFSRVVGELSSQATQHVCIDRFGHTVKAEIGYANFVYQGRKPFASITKPRSCQLVEGKL